jgi:hypothetical protein
VRGDSIRDLYAKALALLGLGVLAGTGALVDYWPMHVSHPVVTPALGRPDAAAAIDPGLIEAPPLPSAPRLAPRPLARTVLPVVANAPEPAPALPMSVGHPAGSVLPLYDPILGVDQAETTEVAALLAPAAMTMAAVSDDEPAAAAPEYLPVAVRTPAVDQEGLGHAVTAPIAGAFKKTGSSIVKTSAKAGASILDAVRVFGGAVRRALPD